MDNDLERSVRFLEDACTITPKTMFKLPKKARFENNLALSLAPHEIQQILESEGASVYNETMNILADKNKSLTGSIIHAGTPWKTAIDNLFIEFANSLQGAENAEILDIAADFARCCSDVLMVVKKLKTKVNVSQIDGENLLEHERNCWRLLYVLYQDRIQFKNDNEPIGNYMGSSEKLCIDNLFKQETVIREHQLVIDWLESNALDKDDNILHNSDWTYGWEHTLHQLLSPDSIPIGSNIDIVKNIHPDAPHFENLSLHHLDLSNEKKFAERIFMEIRCGNLENAQELCYNCGHPWRAAVLEGWKLYHNPNISEFSNENVKTTEIDSQKNQSQYKDIEGNANRDLWKAMALEYCKQPNLNIYEKAAVASLCGDLETMLPVCNNWQDYLWAYMRTMVDVRVESEIRNNIIRNYTQLPEDYWEQKTSLNEIFQKLESSKNSLVRDEAVDINCSIQKLIILNDIPNLINLLNQSIEDSDTPTHSLRFYAHLIIFFDVVGDAVNRVQFENILEAYIKRVSELEETQLVAFYVSKLSKPKQVLLYANHLKDIFDPELRKEALEYAEESNLDIHAITKTIVENICNLSVDIVNTDNLQKKITEEDKIKISVLDWLLFDEDQLSEAIIQTSSVVFKFLTFGKLDAAQLAINKIPSDSISKIKNEYEETNNELKEIVKEFLSYKAYLGAHEGFNEWFKQLKQKPTPPDPLPESAQFTEKVTHQHKVSRHNANLERWKLTSSHLAKTAKTLLYNVLLFPGGWLIGARDADYLRSVCIPEVVILLYSVLSESGLHEEAVQLADLIALEKHGLYKVYSKDKMAEILEKLCESSIALLNAKKDPWGNASSA